MKPRKNELGDKNVIGAKVTRIRNTKRLKQKDLLTKLQVCGMEISSTGLSRLEGQYRRVTDYEILAVAEALDIDLNELLRDDVIE